MRKAARDQSGKAEGEVPNKWQRWTEMTREQWRRKQGRNTTTELKPGNDSDRDIAGQREGQTIHPCS
jgi:hypothetical protein